MPSFGLPSARAEASRRNGAKSRGPKTPEGKVRSSQNALKHGFRTQQFVVVGEEDPQEFAALEAALLSELAPEGALQSVLAARIARAAWRLERAERIEAELFARHADRDGNLGLALIRDGNGARSFDTLLRYRGTTLAELWRALRLLKALQAEAADRVRVVADTRPELLPRQPGHAGVGEVVAAPVALAPPAQRAYCQPPIEPEARGNAGEITSVPAGGRVVATVTPALPEEPPAHCEKPVEPEARGNRGDIAPAPAADGGRGVHGELGAQVTQKCVTLRHVGASHASPPANSARSEAGAGGRT